MNIIVKTKLYKKTIYTPLKISFYIIKSKSLYQQNNIFKISPKILLIPINSASYAKSLRKLFLHDFLTFLAKDSDLDNTLDREDIHLDQFSSELIQET